MSHQPAEPEIDQLTTEASNPRSRQIDTLSTLEIVRLINADDALIAAAVEAESDAIAAAIDVITDRLRQGGRLVYIGAGTSGRLGVLDASECPPTFSTPPEMVVGLIAGGDSALRQAIEGAEDDPQQAVTDLAAIELCDQDVLVGIATSGRTPYVIGALRHAADVGAYPIGLACNADSPMADVARLMITPIVGPELISGSTRMKAGTATKLVLNMLTTGTMVRLGKTYGNLMVDLRASNSKLLARSIRLVSQLTGLDRAQAAEALDQCSGELKTTVVAVLRDVSPDSARALLKQFGGQLRPAIASHLPRNQP
ncbi:N-acetylmuramic acid 6-phosphate etherase [Stieleria sp. TO1_6]|uniref:N-acetylmuramic acid 6-phosphate etherase n=1 Tax=Stieleria tagensis TaxID=2956795 RepID=UPI00209ADE28|nr:N-acetylmuramic acid 6-phosphate etherase [Stieleria tagensis]MCO8122130.1 N-acetylmuramic acid 6-phosphate etherase [Stieleria tagensis]